MIMYAIDHKQIAVPMLSTLVIQILNTAVIQILNTAVIQTLNTTVTTTRLVTILTPIIVVKTQMLEDAADIEDNMVNTLKAYSTKMYYRLL